MQESIHRRMTIEDIFRRFPAKSEQLSNEMEHAGLHCAHCSASSWETLEEGMQNHGLGDEAIDRLVQRLNEILDATDDTKTIILTERAAEQFRSLLAQNGKKGWGLRFGIQSAGCCGFEYFLDYSENAKQDDQTFESHGVQIHIEQKSVQRLIGSVIDYVEGKQGAGFKIFSSSPHSCCCGN